MTRASTGWRAAAVAVVLMLAAVVVTALPRGAAAGIYDPETFTLDNGLRVVVVTNRSAPVVSHMLWYGVGAADEPPGRSGVAHYLEHLMFLGTEELPAGAFNRIVARHGGQDNAFTSWDYTAYFQNVAVDRLELMMEMEADRMANLQIPQEQALNERSVVIEERRQRTDNDPSARLTEQMFAALFQNHPYGIPIIGWAHEIETLTPDDATAFYRTWYAPNNAVLVVSGDIDAETLRPIAERTYGKIPARPVPERARPREPEMSAERRVVVRDDGVRLPDWRRFYVAPAYGGGDGTEAYALQVLNEILGAGGTSRLYRALVKDQQIAVGAGTNYSAHDLDHSVFAAFITPAADADLDAVEAAYEAEVARLIDEGVGADELAAAKQRLITESTFGRDSLMAPAYAFGLALSTGRDVEDVEAWPERIAAVTAAPDPATRPAIWRAVRLPNRIRRLTSDSWVNPATIRSIPPANATVIPVSAGSP